MNKSYVRILCNNQVDYVILGPLHYSKTTIYFRYIPKDYSVYMFIKHRNLNYKKFYE